MNIKAIAVLAFVIGCTCAIPMEEPKGNDTLSLLSDPLPATEEDPKKPSMNSTSAKVNETVPALPGKNESLSLGKHPKLRAALEEKNMTMMPKEKHSMSMSTFKFGPKKEAEPEMLDIKKLLGHKEAAMKKSEAAEKRPEEILMDDKDLMPEPEKFEPATNMSSPIASLMDNSSIPEQNDEALEEAILKSGLLETENGNSTVQEAMKEVVMRDAEGNALKKTKDCDKAHAATGLVERDIKVDMKNNTMNDTLVKNATDGKQRSRRSSSEMRYAVRNARPVKSSYEPAAAPPAVKSSYEPAAAPPAVKSSYEPAAAPPAVKSSYEPAAAPPAVKSSYEPAAPPARSSYPRAASTRSTYQAPATRSSYAPAPEAPATKSSYAPAPEAPATKSSYAPAPQAPATRSSYAPATKSSYAPAPEAPATKSSYAPAPQAPATRSSYAPATRSSYAPAPEAPATKSSYAPAPQAPATRSSYAPATRSSYAPAPEAPATKSSYEPAPQAPATKSSYEAAPQAPARSTHRAPAMVRSSYQAPATRSSGY